MGVSESFVGGQRQGRCDPTRCPLNGQDSIYFERNDFDDLTVEHNVLVNAVLFWVSNNGVGGIRPNGWSFRYNILPAITYDDKTYPAVSADCNVFIPSSAASTFLMKVTGTDGQSGFWSGTRRRSRRIRPWRTTRWRCRLRSGPTVRFSGVT